MCVCVVCVCVCCVCVFVCVCCVCVCVMVTMCCHGNVVAQLVVTQVQFEDGQMISASKWGQNQTQDKLELSPEEVVISDKLKVSVVGWEGGYVLSLCVGQV